ncbi:TetR/AcrR family transcriptional regulator [Mycolicibacterium sp. CH28]|uniref:TetR/AcrR family transcriptional regulator n=1 Tax=Mycolicibacterium sp. CH28 TaxID=2512237 RepID=UPI001081BF8F|nr:TetR/AcrR family transcriptional regulator [Mycolicibacterium sp. CH28]TGD86766.1 TetR/AcrR family transcriptional regulator [Mycolicibacterium sp. CH28]
MKYGPDWYPVTVDWSSTRGRILLAAASLFAQRGFFGTSTRDIADAVRIRQPSLFHHFEAKHAIYQTLVELDLGPSVERIHRYLDEDTSWAGKLHLSIACDVRQALDQPFDSRGLYQDAVLGLDEFADERAGIALFHELVERVVTGGVAAGEFVAFEPGFVQRAINGVLFETLREQGGPGGRVRGRRPLEAADFVLRALLTDQSRLVGLQSETTARLAQLAVGAG